MRLRVKKNGVEIPSATVEIPGAYLTFFDEAVTFTNTDALSIDILGDDDVLLPQSTDP
jgi:hypothetical protein